MVLVPQGFLYWEPFNAKERSGRVVWSWYVWRSSHNGVDSGTTSLRKNSISTECPSHQQTSTSGRTPPSNALSTPITHSTITSKENLCLPIYPATICETISSTGSIFGKLKSISSLTPLRMTSNLFRNKINSLCKYNLFWQIIKQLRCLIM